MHRFTIAAASLIAATVSMGGCETGPKSEPETIAKVGVPVPKPDPARTEYSTLFDLCKSGEATPERVQEFLDLGADVNATESDRIGVTPLHSAALFNKNPEVLRVLIEAGADVSATSKDGYTPLHQAVLSRNPEVVTLLLDAGADVNAKGEYSLTPLHQAVFFDRKTEVIRVLIEAGADVNAKNVIGGTPLHAAAYNKEDPEVIRVLIEAGADVNAKTEGGTTPLDWATSPPRGKPKPKNAEVLRAAGGKRGKDLP